MKVPLSIERDVFGEWFEGDVEVRVLDAHPEDGSRKSRTRLWSYEVLFEGRVVDIPLTDDEIEEVEEAINDVE